jgi:aspartate aminotransferase-like enzyme
MGLFAADAPSAAATSILPPAGVSATLIVKELKSRFGTIITDGQGEMKGQIFRIAHLGFFDYMDTIAILGALEQVVAKSFPTPGFAFGNGLIAAQKVYAERSPTAAADGTCLCGRADQSCSLKHADAGATLVGAK